MTAESRDYSKDHTERKSKTGRQFVGIDEPFLRRQPRTESQVQPVLTGELSIRRFIGTFI